MKPVASSAAPRFVSRATAAAARFTSAFFLLLTAGIPAAPAQIGTRFPAEKKVVIDETTGVPLTFLTSRPAGDAKIYQTHHPWTSDGQWLVFQSHRAPAQTMAVHEATGHLVQVTANGYSGRLGLAEHAMSRYFLRILPPPGETSPKPAAAGRSMNSGAIPVPAKLLQRTYAARPTEPPSRCST